MKLIDVHCHINDEDYGDINALLTRVKECGVEKIIAVGFDLNSSLYAQKLSQKYPSVYFTAGVHPTELKGYKEGDLQEIARISLDEKCVAIGEIGLDYHYPDTNKALQREIFIRQIKTAYEMKLPVQIHSRDCAEDTLAVLKENEKYLKYGAMLHCYSYSVEIAKICEDMGLYFSFGGTSTYSGSKRAQKCIKALPIERLLTETDSPYLAPASRKGQFPNTPESISEICANMACLKGISADVAAQNVWNNAHLLFKKLN